MEASLVPPDEGSSDRQNGRQRTLDIDDIARSRAEASLKTASGRVIYTVSDRPPWYTTLLLAFQHALGTFSGAVTMPLIVASYMCIDDDLDSLSRVIASTFFVMAIQTLLQVTFGVRLPIVQGPTITFVLPMFTLMALRGDCPVVGEPISNSTNETVTEEIVRTEFRNRMREFQGALLIASLFETAVGFFGVITMVLRFIGPITIAPTVGLIGLSMFDIAVDMCQSHWGISAVTVFLVVLFSQYLEGIMVPCVGYTREKGFHLVKFPLFKIYSIILASLITWLLCFILTVTGAFPSDPEAQGYRARTDAQAESLARTPWFFLPSPGQWGAPIFTAGGVLGVTAGTFASIIESIGDYFACAKLAGATPPPGHAVNRGIGMEGLGGFFSALWGTGTSATSYSSSVGYIGITKVASRVVIMVMAVIIFFGGIFLKFSAFFATLPQPIIGGVFASNIGLIAAVGMANLQYVDMDSPRNLFVVGFAFFFGLAIPQHIQRIPNLIQTGDPTLDQVLVAILSTSMFVGGAVACFLDNTVPGTPEERGIDKYWKFYEADRHSDDDVHDEATELQIQAKVAMIVNECYDMPFGMDRIRSWSWASYLPFSPTFRGFHFAYCRCGCRRRQRQHNVTR